MQVCEVYTLIITRDLTFSSIMRRCIFPKYLSCLPRLSAFPDNVNHLKGSSLSPGCRTSIPSVSAAYSSPQTTSSLSSLVRIEREVSVLLSFCLTPAVHVLAPLNDVTSYRLWACSCSDCRETWRLEGIAGYAWLRLGPIWSCWWSRGRKGVSASMPHLESHTLSKHTLNHHGL